MAEHLLPVGLGECDHGVGDREVELPALRLQGRDLHRGLGGDRVVAAPASRGSADRGPT